MIEATNIVNCCQTINNIIFWIVTPDSRLTVLNSVVQSQANIEEKFEALQKKEEEMQELRKSLRERERLIENINAVVLNHEDDVKVCRSFVVDVGCVMRRSVIVIVIPGTVWYGIVWCGSCGKVMVR